MEENNKKCVDFNCDLAQTNAAEEDKALELIERVSSVNIACGLHTGCPLAMKKAIEHCKFKNKVIGALIGLPEGINDALSLGEEEIEAFVLYQLGAISAFAKAYSLNVEHVRPHGVMYELAAQNKDFSVSIAKAVKKFSEWFVYYGAMGEVIQETAQEVNINIAQEIKVFDNDSLAKMKELLENKTDFDTVHFSAQTQDVAELIKNAENLVLPRPVNFKNVVESGWV